MATIEIQLKAYAKILGTDRNCQVDLKRSVFEIDRDVNEIRIPLQAIVKLRKTVPQPSAPCAVSSSILPTPQHAQMSLPVIGKLPCRDEDHQCQIQHQPQLLQDPNLQTMVSTFNIPITVGKETKLVKTTLRYKKAPKAPVAETDTQTEENVSKQMPLTDLYPKDPVARALMFHQDRLQPVKQALRDIKAKISNLRLEQKTTRHYPDKGAEAFFGAETSACPFYQYLINQEGGGLVEMDTPLSRILGSNLLLQVQNAQLEAGYGRPSQRLSSLRDSQRLSRVSGATEASKSSGSGASGEDDEEKEGEAGSEAKS